MKKRRLIILLIIIFLIFILLLTYYKFFLKKESKEEFVKYELTEKYENNQSGNDTEKYSANIIKDLKNNYDFEYVSDNKGIVGQIFIKDKYLYVYEKNKNKSYKISNEKFTTLYTNNDSINFFRYYGISENGNLYIIYLKEVDIKKIKVEKIETNLKVTNFTTLEYKYADSIKTSNIIVIESDKNAYDVSTGIRYSNDIINFYGNYYVYSDNTISNYMGRILKYENNKKIKIKYFLNFSDNNLFENANSVIITEDNKVIYIKETTGELFVYNKTIKKIEYKLIEGNYREARVNIVWNDSKTNEFKAVYTDYYGFE